RSPDAQDFRTRQWLVQDQVLPEPFTLDSDSTVSDPAYIPLNQNLNNSLSNVRQFSAFEAYPDSGAFDQGQVHLDSRLVGHSVWNTRWMLILPGTSLLGDPNDGLDLFVQQVKDIKLVIQTYSYSGGRR